MDRTLWSVRSPASLLDPRVAKLVRLARGGLAEWIERAVNSSLVEGVFFLPVPLTMVWFALPEKKLSLDLIGLDNLSTKPPLPLGKVMEWIVAFQLQSVLDEIDDITPNPASQLIAGWR